jgi:hypothetical protein
MRASVLKEPPIPLDPELYASPAPGLAAFSAWAKREGIGLLFVWNPIVDNSAYHDPRFAVFAERMRETYAAIGIQALGQPEDYLLNADEMLDTRHHATSIGRHRLSVTLLRQLCAAVGCPTEGGGTPGSSRS